ncbi:macrolide ABC transporter permease/ATP-binding protein MacB [Phyllobacterium phragmitis]|uniref:Pyoverdine export ATP-binding/permease protein PvdT n=1 Tax=Phyllobacterium phragmitis TaxID=2670329 RepID=A0A2S9IMM3_9HYPH|nr:MacB family efflux pump subunit [Phyllobacterium phragmitis]PRD41765.1 macrolide ABC transporter permease/ATP-binding protein MacB [Phyllobacterium phragmitis]
MTEQPLISLKGVFRHYPSGDDYTTVLKHIDLTIHRGEMVAIIGASGSGKSTLMNILGCLDRPSEGQYLISGRETSELEPDELAELRREHFGFIFQRYHLLAELDAVGNVEIPAIYAGQNREKRRSKAQAILQRLGMGDRTHHRPSQLSGGQQQRVSIARALINDADVILADEPTGALDSRSGEEVLDILGELNREGRTIIIVTHDRNVAARAGRIIEIRDGEIIADTATDVASQADASGGALTRKQGKAGLFSGLRDRFGEAFAMALRSMNAHRMRTFLTMLGIIIGTASVICVVALGEGSRQHILDQISDLGTNTLEIYPGHGFGDLKAAQITTLTVDDARELGKLPYIMAATPTASTASTVRVGDKEVGAQVRGVGQQYFLTRNSKLTEGRFFDQSSVDSLAQDAVIDTNARKTLFPNVSGSVIGKIFLLPKMPVRVIGVIKSEERGMGSDQSLSVFLPYTTVQTRMTGSQTLESIILRVRDNTDPAQAEKMVTAFLKQRHGEPDFFIFNTDSFHKTVEATTQALAILIASIAGISLFVGGIGVMNIMLVAVSERINEIGVRMAVGARQSDILQQFLIEAVLVCLLGGLVGVLIAGGFGLLFSEFNTSFHLIYSPMSIVIAIACSSLIGIGFGFFPARNASKLDPVVALARD